MLQDSNRDDAVSEPQPSTSRHVSSTSVSEVDPTPASSMSNSAMPSNSTEVACVLAEMGVADFPDERQQISSHPPAESSAGPSQPIVEPQAPPLPKKVPIPPVMVEAPFNTIMVDDIPSCVYPNPPSYHEATTDAPPNPDSTPSVQISSPENQTKTNSRPKEVLNKIWAKRSPKKMKKLLNFPLFQVFSFGQSNGNDTAENVHLDDEQVQLISDFVSDDVTDDVELLSGDLGERNRLPNPQVDEDGSSVFEMQSYSSPNQDAESRNMEDRGSPVSLLIEIPPVEPVLAPIHSPDENSSVPGHEDNTAIELPPLDFSQR